MKLLLIAIVATLTVIPALAQDAGWIGVSVDDQRDTGPIVRRVEANSPAEKAGLRDGDVIVEYNREQVAGVLHLTRLVRETPVGRTVDIKVRRDNREQTFKITIDRGAGFGRFEFNTPDVRVFADRALRNIPRIEMNTIHVQSGVRVEQITDQLREFFGVTGGNGVLVTAVDSGSAAEKAGLKAGDVVISVDGRSIRTPNDFSREMRANSRPMVMIVRDKKEREIRIE
jgi:serine protease Do